MRRRTFREFIDQNKYLIFVIYYTLYMVGFGLVESLRPAHIYIIHCPLDNYIPFLEIFVIPYLGWFLFIGGTVVWLFFNDRETMCRLLWCGMIGMTVFLLISFFLPNGLDLRPESFERDNIFITLTKIVYSSDTSTNVFPSIHVNNSICACAALLYSDKLKEKKWARGAAVLVAVLIILSTMFLKQHSVVDVSAGILLGFISCKVCFTDDLRALNEEYSVGRRKRRFWTKFVD